MNALELWRLALAHHVPYFVAGMLLIWQWPTLTGWWESRKVARTELHPPPIAEPGRASEEAPTPSELQLKLQEISVRQEEAARQLATLQQAELKGPRKEHV